ncbi:hypothetical protein VXM67_22580 [Pseudomonas sp. Rh2]|uniref:hypothetical protein n=1 Tax=Pseudomonas TaxID=286 RepID=UPI0011DD2513|nr:MULTISPECIES: hypothetical protein [Pseudomonas]MDT8922647.1 hypothetical protein [Pseudomonas taiwanensis]QQZ35498.1 hypothetical protein IF103_20105 [Pseudomonas sp. SK2]
MNESLESGVITIGNIGDEHDLEIPAGVYKLIYELGQKKATMVSPQNDAQTLKGIVEKARLQLRIT